MTRPLSNRARLSKMQKRLGKIAERKGTLFGSGKPSYLDARSGLSGTEARRLARIERAIIPRIAVGERRPYGKPSILEGMMVRTKARVVRRKTRALKNAKRRGR